jgi:methionine-rich copper-binding protein CopC
VSARLRPVAAGLVAVLLAMAGVLASATVASAHDRLQSTTPKQGSTVQAPPPAITLTFSSKIVELGSQVRVTGPSGDVTAGEPVLDGRTVRQAIQPGVPAGAYTVAWQVTSSDGHPIAGTWKFTVADAAAAPTTAAPTTPVPTVTETPAATAPPTTVASSSSGDDDDSSTGLIVMLTAIGAVVLLAAAGAVAWAGRRPGS